MESSEPTNVAAAERAAEPALSATDVRWAYRYYLARQVESETIPAHHAERHDAPEFRRLIFGSDEHRAVGVRTPATSFTVLRPGAPKVVVIGNCQAPNLARAIAAMTDASCYGFQVMSWFAERDQILADLEACDHIVSQPLSETYGELEKGALRQRYGSKLTLVPNIHFEGLHPDLTYVGGRGARVQSPAGDYHSRLVLRGFLARLSVAETMALFCERVFVKHHYPAIFAQSRAELERREAETDVPIGDWLFARALEAPVLFSINHPTAETFVEQGRRVAAALGLRPRPIHPGLVHNSLTENVIWPVHDCLAGLLGLRYPGSENFWINGCLLGLEEFVWRSFELYGQNREALEEWGRPIGFDEARDFM